MHLRTLPTGHLIHGFVGTGKTTYAVELENKLPALRFSIDDWMTALYGQNPLEDKFEDYHRRTSHLIWTTASRVLELGQDVIMDFGFWSRASRDDARRRAYDVGAQAQLYFVTCADDLMKSRVQNRTANMPTGALYINEQAIESFRQRFEPLEPDEPYKLIRTDL